MEVTSEPVVRVDLPNVKMKDKEQPETLDNLFRQTMGYEPFIEFTRAEESPVQWIHWLDTIDSQTTNLGMGLDPNGSRQEVLGSQTMTGENPGTSKDPVQSGMNNIILGTGLQTPLNFSETMVAFAQAAVKGNELPGWPLMSNKVQKQKCGKCSSEFYSTINQRRHMQTKHRHTLNGGKEKLEKKKEQIGAFWNKRSTEMAYDIVSIKSISSVDPSAAAVIEALSSQLEQPHLLSIPQSYAEVGRALLDIVQNKPSIFPLSSELFLNLLEDASERNLLFSVSSSMEPYIFGSKPGQIVLEARNQVASLGFVVEQALKNAWLDFQTAEAREHEKALVEEEELAQKKRTKLQEKKRQKKMRQKESKDKERQRDDTLTVIQTRQCPGQLDASNMDNDDGRAEVANKGLTDEQGLHGDLHIPGAVEETDDEQGLHGDLEQRDVCIPGAVEETGDEPGLHGDMDQRDDACIPGAVEETGDEQGLHCDLEQRADACIPCAVEEIGDEQGLHGDLEERADVRIPGAVEETGDEQGLHGDLEDRADVGIPGAVEETGDEQGLHGDLDQRDDACIPAAVEETGDEQGLHGVLDQRDVCILGSADLRINTAEETVDFRCSGEEEVSQAVGDTADTSAQCSSTGGSEGVSVQRIGQWGDIAEEEPVDFRGSWEQEASQAVGDTGDIGGSEGVSKQRIGRGDIDVEETGDFRRSGEEEASRAVGDTRVVSEQGIRRWGDIAEEEAGEFRGSGEVEASRVVCDTRDTSIQWSRDVSEQSIGRWGKRVSEWSDSSSHPNRRQCNYLHGSQNILRRPYNMGGSSAPWSSDLSTVSRSSFTPRHGQYREMHSGIRRTVNRGSGYAIWTRRPRRNDRLVSVRPDERTSRAAVDRQQEQSLREDSSSIDVSRSATSTRRTGDISHDRHSANLDRSEGGLIRGSSASFACTTSLSSSSISAKVQAEEQAKEAILPNAFSLHVADLDGRCIVTGEPVNFPSGGLVIGSLIIPLEHTWSNVLESDKHLPGVEELTGRNSEAEVQVECPSSSEAGQVGPEPVCCLRAEDTSQTSSQELGISSHMPSTGGDPQQAEGLEGDHSTHGTDTSASRQGRVIADFLSQRWEDVIASYDSVDTVVYQEGSEDLWRT